MEVCKSLQQMQQNIAQSPIGMYLLLHKITKMIIYSTICCRMVAAKMGGPVARGQVAQFSWELPISQLKYEKKSNVVPIGSIKAGIFVHRALLFKVKCMRVYSFDCAKCLA